MDGHSTDRLQDYPFATVRVACGRCERQGRSGRSKLIAAYGPDAAMHDLRQLIVGCDERHKPGNSCAAYYPDLMTG